MIEIIGSVAAFLTTASFLPQTIHTLKTRDTSGISFAMYLMFVVGVAFWLTYGVLLENKVIVVANIVTFILAGLVLAVKIKNSK
ncbi:MAG: SemiSWEET transporter [Rickettsiales bacterium]|nr:SemiSWEET transporter [Rickettsiales bacterium]